MFKNDADRRAGMELATAIEDVVTAMDRDVDAVIVEGKRDETALRRAGFTGDVYTCSTADGLIHLARELPHDVDVAILTDFDQEGRSMHGRLRDAIPGRNVQGVWRKKLQRLLTADGRRDIEALNNVLDDR